jgi:hypothetical protein
MKKPHFRSMRVSVGGAGYDVLVRVFPARAAAKDAQVIRILRAAVDVTDELTCWMQAEIKKAVDDQIKLGGNREGRLLAGAKNRSRRFE